MKFHRITLRDYRGIRYCQVEPRENGVTVIEGDNEIGKSSIAEALWLIFEQHDDSSSQLVKSLRPADRDAATEVEVEVSTGPYRFTYFKRFHRGPRTELKIASPQREILAGREADNRANAILRETIDVSLWKALRSQQGMQDSLEPPAAGQHRSLMGALETAAGPLMGGDREQAVFLAAQQEYEKYFTPSGREKASGEGPSLPKLRIAEIDAMAEVDRISSRMRELEDRAQRGAELEQALASLAAELATTTSARDTLTAAARSREEASQRVEKLRAELQAREAEARSFANEAEYREHAAAAIEPLRTQLAGFQEEAAAAGPEVESLKAGVATAEATFVDADQALQSARAALMRADDLVQLSARQLQVDQMAERLERLDRLEPDLARLADWLANCKMDGRRLAELEKLDRDLVALEARRDAEAAAVEITAASDTSIRIGDKEVPLAAGQTRRGNVRETVMEFPGGITVTIRAGSAARQSEEGLRNAQDELASRLAAAGAASLEDARAILQERAATEERRKQFEAQVQNDLRDLASRQDLADKLSRERSAITGILQGNGLDALPDLDGAKASRETAVTALAAVERAQGEAAAARELAAQRLGDAEHKGATLAARVTAAKAELDRAEQELDRLRERQDDETLSAAISSAHDACRSAESSLADAVASLATMADVTSELRDVSAKADQLARKHSEASREEAGIRALLEDAGAAGLHGQLVEAEQHLTAVSDELAAFSRRAAAARLLFETLRARRDEARENYAGPLKDCIEALGRRVYNDSFGIELSEDLRITRRTLDGIALDLAQISVGAREQLSVLTRLACAALVSQDGGAPLVLDDILGWADPKRLEALGPVLAEAAGESQVILFTCSPERFASVSPALVISLPSGQRSERTASGETMPVPVQPPARVSRVPATATAAPSRPPQGSFELFDVPGSRVN